MLFKIRRKIFYVLSFLSSFVCFLFGTLFIIMICYGNSMAPNHYNKAILFFWQQDFKVERNDVVAVKYPENWDLDYQINFKRIIGVPGDEVRFEGNYILINGRKLWYWEGAYFGIIKGIEEGRIKEDYYYIKGDAHNSFDSNYIGLVHRSRILGKLLFIIHKGEKPAEEIPDLYKKPLLH